MSSSSRPPAQDAAGTGGPWQDCAASPAPPAGGGHDRRQADPIKTSSGKTPLRTLALRAVLAAVALVAIAAGAVWFEIGRPLEIPGGHAEVRVASGASARTIARQLRDAGVPLPAWEFVGAATLTHATRSLRPGRYRIEGRASVLDLVDKFRHGDFEREQLTVLEGSTFAELRALLARSPDLRHETAGWSEAQLLKALGTSEPAAEGLFAPDTYTFDPGSSDLEIYRQAYLAQKDRLMHAWQLRGENLPYTGPYQALVMASIIEKETGRSEERGQIAAVFVNRQRLGMPLQTDPTVIYGLGSAFDGRLHKRDLLHDTPYNTYTRPGLPPTPISLPGRAAIDAALNPDLSKALYFVARGDGTSEFSDSLADHNRAVDRFQRGVGRRPSADKAAEHTVTKAVGKAATTPLSK